MDMDAFYVNVHLLEHPEDRGLPLVVGGRPEHRGVVSSASYEARKSGVRSAMPTSRALRLIPNLKIVGADWSRIKESSRQVMGLLGNYGPLERMSVDEAYIDLSDSDDPAGQAPVIQQRVRSETGLPASVGLASNKLVAKVASDFEKPEGCTIVRPGEEAAFLTPLPVRVIWGIGPRTAERLATLGIETCGQLASIDLDKLRPHFGREAESLVWRAKGIDSRPVTTDHGPAKSISQEWTYSQDVVDQAVLHETVRKMAGELAESLRRRGLVARSVRIKLRWPDFTTFTRQRSFAIDTDDVETIARVAETLLHENRPAAQAVRLIGVAVTGLTESEGRQLGLKLD